MLKAYPFHLLVISKKTEKYQALSNYIEKISYAHSLGKALKLVTEDKPNQVIVEDELSAKSIGFILNKIFQIPLNINNASLPPLTYDLKPYFKPAYYRPVIKTILRDQNPTIKDLHQADMFVMEPDKKWGESGVKAAAAGLAVIGPSESELKYLCSHPEEAYKQAKNTQSWVMRHIESDILPDYFSKKLYEKMTSKDTIKP